MVVDTAPTAHTLRLVATPEVLTRIATLLDSLQEKHRQIAQHFGSGYHPDRVDAALDEIEDEGRGLAALLADRERTRFLWLLLPEALSLAEAKDGVAALQAAGIAVDEVIVNRVTPPGDLCASCGERRRAELTVIAAAAAAFPDYRLRLLPALGREPRGVAGLRRMGKALADPSAGQDLLVEPVEPSKPSKKTPIRRQSSRPSRRPEWPGLLAPPGVRLLLFGGKGGVGKTTCAATAALALAAERPEERLLLLSTDPAHSLGDVLDVPLADDLRQLPHGPPNLWARELDAVRALERWGEDSGDESSGDRREAIEGLLAAFFGPPGDREARAEIAEPLSGVTPSGLDELMAILALADALFGDAYDLVVVDLAPTGHALRLLEMPALALTWDRALLALLLKYREAVRPGVLAAELVELSRTLNRLAALLADPGRTRFVPVARAAELPRRETARLLAALKRLGIATAPLLVNAVAAAGCDRCEERKDAEERELDRLRALVPSRSAILLAPAFYPPPRGIAALADWGRSWRRSPS